MDRCLPFNPPFDRGPIEREERIERSPQRCRRAPPAQAASVTRHGPLPLHGLHKAPGLKNAHPFEGGGESAAAHRCRRARLS